MSIGLGIVLFVIGAILAFAINLDVSGIDLQMIGYILMGAGVVIVLIGIVLLAVRRRSVSSTSVRNDPRTGDREVRSETSAPPPADIA